MLSAEHYALENGAIMSMLAIRQKELDYYDTRMAAMGIQSALIGGFVIFNLNNNFVGPGNNFEAGENTTYKVLFVFYVSTGLSLSFAFHVILLTMYCSIWGPGLALRGGTGSVSRALTEMKAERKNIVAAFCWMIITFGVQNCTTFIAYDGVVSLSFSNKYSRPALVSCIILGIGSILTFWTIWRMKNRMSKTSFMKMKLRRVRTGFWSKFWWPGSQHSDAPLVAGISEDLKHNINIKHGLGHMMMERLGVHEDWSTDVAPTMVDGAAKSSAAVSEMKGLAFRQGYLQMKKKTAWASLARMRTRTRYFVLQGSTFVHYDDEKAYLASSGSGGSGSSGGSGGGVEGGGSSGGVGTGNSHVLDVERREGGGEGARTGAGRGEPLPLYGYEADTAFRFYIKPLSNLEKQAEYVFRPKDAAERNAWVEALLAATIMAHEGDELQQRGS